MSLISIEQYSEKIYHSKSKEYFQEVIQSYINGSYRSATVMLYSVVICDLIYKLKELEQRYGDLKAQKILQDIEKIRDKDDMSSEWETKLVEMVYNRTRLLEKHDFVNIQQLKQHRNLSAHPVLNELDILFKPNQETVRAHMRNILEGVLLKSPILSNEIIGQFIEDIANVKETLIDKISLEKYLTAKYFKYFNLDLEKKVLKTLWKFVFKINEPECVINREVNFNVLEIMINRRRLEMIGFIEEEKNYFSDIADNKQNITYLIKLLALYRPIFEVLEDHAEVLILKYIDTDISMYINSPFLSETIEEHFETIERKLLHSNSYGGTYGLSLKDSNNLYTLAKENQVIERFLELTILNFSRSHNFNSADERFENAIFPFLENYKHDDFMTLLEVVNTNSQIHSRGRAVRDNKQIKMHSDKVLGNDFEYEDTFPNFEFG